MVKFGKYLQAHSVTEWQSQYVRYKQLKKLLKQVAAEKKAASSADGSDSSTLHSARQVALSSRQWARTARLRVEEEEKNAPVFATYMQHASDAHEQSTTAAGKPSPPGLVHHMDRFHSIDSTAPLHSPPDPKSVPPFPSLASTLPPASNLAPSEHSHVFTSLFASRLQSESAEWRFFELLDEDLVTVNTFFLRQEEFFLSKAEVLSDQLTALLSNPHTAAAASPASLLHPLGRKSDSELPSHAQHVLERALKELYRGLQLLRNYKIMNYTAFVKILKKHDKVGTFSSSGEAIAAVNASHAIASPLLNDMIAHCEQLYASVFNRGNRRKGVNSLRIDPAPQSLWMTFRLGLFVGLSLSLLLVLPFIIQYIQSQSSSLPNLSSALPVFRCLGLIFLNLWLWGFCIHTLHLSRINWTFILELDATHHMKSTEVIHAAATMTFLWLGALDLYLYCTLERASGNFTSIRPVFFPFSLFFFSVFLFFCPVHLAHFRTRAFLARSLWHVVTAPFARVDFADAFIGDQLCSLVNIFSDVFYSFCFFLSGDFFSSDATTCTDAASYAVWVLAILPYYWRLQQCLRRYRDTKNTRFLANACKYCSSILITLLSLTYKQVGSTATLALWITAAICGTLFIYYWDIKYDWGLLEPAHLHWSDPHFLLRKELTLQYRFFYYFSMVSNFLLRITWVFTISPTSYGIPIPSDYFKSIIYSLEIVRRQQWNFYRLENEHLTNCEHYRVVNIVPLPMTVSDIEVGAHTAPEAAVLIRQDSRSKELQQQDGLHDEERKELEVAPVDGLQRQSSEGPMMRVSRRDSPPRASILRHFSLGRADDDSSPDSSPDSRADAPHSGPATSPRSVTNASSSSSAAVLPPSSISPSHPLLAAASVVQMASAGVPELEEAMRAAMRVKETELAKMRSTPSVIANMRDALEKEMSQYGLQGRRASLGSNHSSPEVSRVRNEQQQQAGKSARDSPSKTGSPSSSALNSSPEASSGEEEDQQRPAHHTTGVGRRGSASGSGSGGGRGVGASKPLHSRSASPPPIDTGLSMTSASVLSVPLWLSATPLLQAGPSSSPPSAEMRAALETSTGRTPKLSRHNSQEREKKQ